MNDCNLSHDAVMNALIEPYDQPPPTDTLVTCLMIDTDVDFDRPESLAQSLEAIYDTSLKRSRDGHLIKLPPQTDQIDASSATDGQSNSNQESSLTATASHSKESEITCRNSVESDEELVDLMQHRPLTLFESLIDHMLDNIQPTSPSKYACSDSVFDFCFKYFGQALKETNLTFLDLGGKKISSDLFFDFAKNLKGTQIATLNLPIIDYNSGKSVSKDLAKCSIDDNVKSNADKSNIDITLVDSSCNEKAQCLELLPTILLEDTQISSLDFSSNPINLKMLSSSLIGSKIACLGLRGCKIQKDGLSCLARILKDTQIASIDLGYNELDCESLKIFAPGLEGTRIKSLNLSHNKIGVEGINCLGNVFKNTQITSLDISHNNLNSGTLEVFVNCLVDSKITSLCLKDNNIGGDNLKCLSSVLKNTQITSIGINGLSCKSLKAMSAGLVGSKINWLNLGGCYFNYFGDDDDDDDDGDDDDDDDDDGDDDDDDDDGGFLYLGNVLKDTQITAIDLSYNALNQRRFEVFAPCLVNTKITSLGLEGNRIGIRELNCLGNVLKNTQITSINLCRNECIQGVSELCLTDTKITSLNLGVNTVEIDELKCLGNLLKDSEVTSFDFGGNHMSDMSIEMFASILIDSTITSLDLSGSHLENYGGKCIASVLKNTQITSLNLGNCQLKCNGLKNLIMVLPDTKITSLNLSGNYFCCNYFYLAFVLKHTQITSLNISNDSSSQCHPTYSLQMLNEDNTSLDLRNGNACTLSLCYLARILKNTKLVSLNLSSNEIDCNDLKYMSQGLLNSEIVELNLSCSNIDCSGAYYLAQVLRQTRIKSLNLSRNRIACEGAKYLAQGIVDSQIASLDLSGNSISDEGAKYLAQGIVGSQIASLDLSGNCIKDEGAKYLAECLADTQIIELDLGINMIGIEAAYQLLISVRQKQDESMHIRIDNSHDVCPYDFRLYRYPGCFIEINTIVPTTKEGASGCLINNTYKKRGITKLILRSNDYYDGNLDVSFFDNMNITEIELKSTEQCLNEAIIFEKSNIAKLKIDSDRHLQKLLHRINVIALHLFRSFHSLLLSLCNLKSVLMESNIVYLDLSNTYYIINYEELVEVLKGSKIISLDLSNNLLEAGCVELLARVLPDTKLTYIDLHGNKIGNLGFKYLLDVVDKTSICWLSLGNNNIEGEFPSDVELSPYIVPRNNTPIEYQIRYLFRELVSLNTASEQFEFIVPRQDSVMTINHYPRLVKHLLDTPIYKMHIYDYFYMQSMRRHDIHVLNRINYFINKIKENFISFFESKMMQIEEKFGCECFFSLVEEFDRLNLTDFVEFLLLHRVLYCVDDDQNFLHPFIYKMLHKYQMPLYNEDLEPNKKQQIISYFEEHSDIDGAREIIDLLK